MNVPQFDEISTVGLFFSVDFSAVFVVMLTDGNFDNPFGNKNNTGMELLGIYFVSISPFFSLPFLYVFDHPWIFFLVFTNPRIFFPQLVRGVRREAARDGRGRQAATGRQRPQHGGRLQTPTGPTVHRPHGTKRTSVRSLRLGPARRRQRGHTGETGEFVCAREREKP